MFLQNTRVFSWLIRRNYHSRIEKKSFTTYSDELSNGDHHGSSLRSSDVSVTYDLRQSCQYSHLL